MEVKKSHSADLENKKGLFFQIGLVIVFSSLLVAFEWTSKPTDIQIIGNLQEIQVEEEIIPITRQPEEIQITPPPPLIIEQLNIVDDKLEIDETDFESMEADENMSVNIMPFSNDEEEAPEDEFFTVVEEMPKFQGKGPEEFRNYISTNLRYPKIVQDMKIEGKVYMQFAINKNGEVCDVVVLKGVHDALDQEATRIIKASPKWTPGKQRGRSVKVLFVFPISFVLN